MTLNCENCKLWKLKEYLLTEDIAFFGYEGLAILCNDLFAWATADAESLPDNQVEYLVKIHKKYGNTGVAVWCSLRRGVEPQEPYLKKHPEFMETKKKILEDQELV